MELTRRDAIGALGTAGIASLAGCSSLFGSENGGPQENAGIQTLVALGEVLYPSETEVTEEFVQTYMYGRITDEQAYQQQLTSGVETLDSEAQSAHEAPFRELSADQRVSVIENTDLRTGDSVPDGNAIEQVNYHLIDELLFAFYASPTGGELVGNTNPRGWPGGFGYVPNGGPS
jgi:hypothetical protein